MALVLSQSQISDFESLCKKWFESKDEYPIDLDDCWKWLGLSKKAHAVRSLKRKCIEGRHFIKFISKIPLGCPVHKYMFTIDGFKRFVALSNTKRSEQLIDYLIKVESEFAKTASQDNILIEPFATDCKLYEEIPITTNNIEQQITKSLQLSIGGTMEVPVWCGRIDLLTDDEIIEVKHISKWKHALGQILSYAFEYPNRRKRIHLFYNDNYSDYYVTKIKQTCEMLNVNVTFESKNNETPKRKYIDNITPNPKHNKRLRGTKQAIKTSFSNFVKQLTS